MHMHIIAHIILLSTPYDGSEPDFRSLPVYSEYSE
jgi:hypothetical protein